MQESYPLVPIARIHTDFPEKFGIPRQSGLVPDLEATILFEPPFRNPDALRGLEGFSHLWLIWQFSTVVAAGADGEHWRPTVRPPRLGGNTRMGVFATRSPFRPNAIGLSCVELREIRLHTDQGPLLRVAGADLLDGTPIFDIKPYLPYVDAHPDARGGFAAASEDYALALDFPPALLDRVPAEKRGALQGVLANDPRPAYQQDPGREYGMSFAGLRVRFRVRDGVLTVTGVEEENDNPDGGRRP